MVKITKVYTRTGDDGTTGLVGGERVEKDSLRVDVYGEVDELNSLIGVVRTIADEQLSSLSDQLKAIQNDLFDIGAELASPPTLPPAEDLRVNVLDVNVLESAIDEFTEKLPELRSFVLPGGTMLNAHLHHARTVCRRVERKLVSLHREEPVRAELLQYVNRLSDLLFCMARAASAEAGAQEYLWTPGSGREKP